MPHKPKILNIIYYFEGELNFRKFVVTKQYSFETFEILFLTRNKV